MESPGISFYPTNPHRLDREVLWCAHTAIVLIID